jgi:hypothetical protein
MAQSQALETDLWKDANSHSHIRSKRNIRLLREADIGFISVNASEAFRDHGKRNQRFLSSKPPAAQTSMDTPAIRNASL